MRGKFRPRRGRRIAALALMLPTGLAAAILAAYDARAAAPVDYSRLFPDVFVREGPSLKRIALTFDDGPDTVYTPQILAILARKHVHATFFVLGQQVQRYPSVTKRILREGHALGNHSFDHADLSRVSPARLDWEVISTDRLLRRYTGSHTAWFRPPYGSVNPFLLRRMQRMGYRVVNWSVDSNDWRSLSANRVEANVLSAVRPGSIILQHCNGNPKEILAGSVAALPAIIETLRAQGYTFVTVPELLMPDARAVHAPHGHHPR
jgi:peptidoglycan/xylan/chitin deacetylase (PgdA/CDA1 family)